MPFLSVSDVSKQFGGVTAVDHVTFAVDRGQVVGFLGPNGAGKSTTMRMITQYYEPDTGAITLDGVPLADASRAAKRRIGYLAENNPLYEDMLVHDYLAFIADLRQLEGLPRRQALDAAVTATGIESVYYRPIAELSKGFRQRVGLAQAILQRPRSTAVSRSPSPSTARGTSDPRSSRSPKPAAGRCTSCTGRPGPSRTCSTSSRRGEPDDAGDVDDCPARAEGAVRPAHGVHPAGRLHRRERLPLFSSVGPLRRRVAAPDVRLPAVGAAVSRPGGDDARPRRGCALGYARGGAGAADQRAGAAARQVCRPGALPMARPRHHAHHPARPRAGHRTPDGDPDRAVRRCGAVAAWARRRRRLGVERHAQPDHRVHPRGDGHVRADPRRARSSGRGPPAPARSDRRVARRPVSFLEHRSRRDRPARRGVFRQPRRAVPGVRVFRVAGPQGHTPSRGPEAAAAGYRVARGGGDRGEPLRTPHRRPD